MAPHSTKALPHLPASTPWSSRPHLRWRTSTGLATAPQNDPMIMLPRTAPSAPAPKRRTRSIWATTAVCLSCAASLPSAVFGQAALPPLDIVYAWTGTSCCVGHGRTPPCKWACNKTQGGTATASPSWACGRGAGWQPEAKGGYNRRGPDPLSFGISFKEDPLSTGWRETFTVDFGSGFGLHQPGLESPRGICPSAHQLGASIPPAWSWNAQYGPGRIRPASPHRRGTGRMEPTAGPASMWPSAWAFLQRVRQDATARPYSREPRPCTTCPAAKRPTSHPQRETPSDGGLHGGWKAKAVWAGRNSNGGPGTGARFKPRATCWNGVWPWAGPLEPQPGSPKHNSATT